MKISQAPADGVFLQAFEVAIEQVHLQLAAAGLNEATIWAAFRRAATKLAEMSGDIDTEASPQMSIRPETPAGHYRPRKAMGE